MPKKLTHEYVDNYYKENIYTLKSEYNGSKNKDQLLCPIGHNVEITFDGFRNGNRCKECRKKIISNKLKHSHDYIFNYYTSKNYSMKSIYKGNKNKDQLICPVGHEINMKFNSFQRGLRCLICSGKEKLSNEYVENYYKKYNYILNSIYKGNKNKDILTCPQGHNITMKFNTFQQGSRCIKCYKNNNFGENHPNFNPDRTIKSRTKYLSFDLKKINMLNDDPNYNNYLLKKEDYNIDHIFPRVAFIDNNLDNIYSNKIIKELCNFRDNLRIIQKEDNKSKAGKYNQCEFLAWFENKLIIKLMNI
jgi:hypothetical protein